MNLEKYEIIKGPGDSYYEFYSEGPKGRIKPIVRFTLLSEYEDDSTISEAALFLVGLKGSHHKFGPQK